MAKVIELTAGTWQVIAEVESQFAFNPGKPITYWVVRYRPNKDSEWLATMVEKVGNYRPSDADFWQAARADFAKRRGLAAG